MTPSHPLGFGIVGIGMIAEFHAQALAHVKGARLVGIASRDLDKAQAFAQKHGAAFATTNVAELAARPEVDIICVTTPSGAHLEPAIIAISARKHVVVEKPIEITLQRIDQLLDAANVAGVRVAAIFQARLGSGAMAVKSAVDGGRFGRLVLASAYVKWSRTPAYYTGWKGTLELDGGGAVINQAIHAVDLLQWFAGVPAEVFCFKTRRVHERIEAEDTAIAALKFADGALGTIEATTAAYPGWQRRLEICGEHGSVVLENDTITRWEFRDTQPGDDAIRARNDSADLGSGASAPNAISFVGHQLQLQNLVDSINNHTPLTVDGREARKAVAIIRALYDSADRGAPVKLS